MVTLAANWRAAVEYGPCESCGAPTGEPCRTYQHYSDAHSVIGRPTAFTHSPRMRAWLARDRAR